MKKLLSIALFVFVLAPTSLWATQDDMGSPDFENPTTLELNKAYQESIDAYGISYYMFTTTKEGVHTIGLTGATSDLGWTIHTDKEFYDYLSGCDNLDVVGDEVCTVELQASTTYYLQVSEWTDQKSDYSLTVSE